MDVRALQAVEDNDVIDSVQEFGGESALQGILDDPAAVVAFLVLLGLRGEAYTGAEVLQLPGPDVRRHDDDGVAEIHPAPEAVGQLSVIQGLQQQVEHIGVGLLDFVQQDDGVGLPADLFGQLATFLVAYVSRRRSDESADRKLFHVLGHVDADQGLFGIKEVLGQFLGKLGLSDPRRAQEDEGSDRLAGVLQACAVPLDGTDHLAHGIGLSDDLVAHVVLHAGQFAAFLLGDALYGDTRHHRNHFLHVVLGHRDAVGLGVLFPLLLGCSEFFGQLALGVPETGGLFVLLTAHHAVLLLLDLFNFLLDVDDLLRDVDVVQVHPAANFVQGINGLVRQVAVGDVAGGQGDAALDGALRVVDRVVLLVLVLDVVEDLYGLLDAGGLDQHLLEAALEGAVLFDVLAVFIKGSGSDALDLASGEGWLEHVGGVQRPTGTTCSDNGVDLVYEQDDVQALLELVHHRFHPFFKLTAVLGSCDKRGDVQGHDALSEEHPRDLLLHDAEGKAFGNRALSYAGLTDEDGIVLLAAGEHLAHTLDFLLPSHDGV